MKLCPLEVIVLLCLESQADLELWLRLLKNKIWKIHGGNQGGVLILGPGGQGRYDSAVDLLVSLAAGISERDLFLRSDVF